MANIYTVKLLKKEEVAKGTMAFYFEKPEGFVYKAGQTADFTLMNPSQTDEEGNIRTFSLASSPFESSLMVATRIRDTAFKRVLKDMEVGTEVKMEAPIGSFTLHNDMSKPAVLLTGGIGITPFRSIILDASERQLPHKIILFYANKTPEDAAFLKELQEVNNPNYTFVGIMTRMEESSQAWNGETGHITKEMLEKYVGELTAPIYYVAGPQDMVTTLRGILSEAGVNEDYIRTEEFPGY